jgi:hypothetical protein
MARTPISYSKKDFLDSFRMKFPNIEISWEDYYKIISAGGTVYADALLEDGEVKMASRLGPLTIRKFKPKGKGTTFGVITDKHKSALQKKAVYQFNDHTGGWMYRFIWNKRKCKSVLDKNMWVFKPIRSLKRRLAYLLKEGGMDYPIATKEL